MDVRMQKKMHKWWLVLLALWVMPAFALQHELAIYAGVPQPVPARIMLLIDTSGSMDQGLGCSRGPTCRSKWTVLVETLGKFIDAQKRTENSQTRWPDDFEIGLARFGVNGAVIELPMGRLGDVVDAASGKTHRDRLAEKVAAMRPSGWTPMVGSYLETLSFLTGGRAVSENAYTASDTGAWADRSALRFRRGINDQLICGVNNNHLVVLTDGLSTQESMSRQVYGAPEGVTYGHRIQQFVNGNTANEYLSTCGAGVSTGNREDVVNPTWPCLNALAEKLADKDPADLTKVRGVRTHTIAYSLGAGSCDRTPFASPSTAPQFLCNWALSGGGNGFAATNEEGLIDAFQSISLDVSLSDSFTAAVPGVGVNQANRFTYLDDVYYSVFQPTDRRFWYGNLKKYRLGLDDNVPVIVGENNRRIDANGDGFFDADARSFWFYRDDYLPALITADGDKVMLGGAALRIPDKDSRRLYTHLNGQDVLVSGTNSASVIDAMLPSDLGDEALETDLRSKASNVLNWLRGDDAEFNNEWARLTGLDPKSVRTLYGAPIHSSPVVVNYTSTRKNAAGQNIPIDDVAAQDNLVFVSTNDGKLYAVDALSGQEKLAFVPGELLTRGQDGAVPVVERLYDAARGNEQGPVLFGLDGSWKVWRQDVNRDGNITASESSKDFVFMYGGMRRGGRNVYGLDVTAANDSAPGMKQLFVLKGGSAGTPLAEMGQTWSEPVLGLMRYSDGKSLVVLILAGGYDPVYDDGRPATGTVPLGAQLYIVAAHKHPELNVEAGDVLWWASSGSVGAGVRHLQVDELTDSIPSTVKTLDRDGDGYFDHIYVGDLGGQLFRFDILAPLSDSNAISATRIASLGYRNQASASHDRRFFYPPSVALMKDEAGRRHVALAIGSGLLTSPRDTDVDEQFFFLKDYEPFGITVDAEDNPPFAYSLELESEKLMGSPLIVGGQVFFSTYYWGDNDSMSSASECRAQYGRAALYQYNPRDAADPQRILRAQPLSLAGGLGTLLKEIPARPEDGENPAVPAGTDFLGIGGTSVFDLPDVDMGNIRKTRWKQCPDEGAEVCK